jgi:phosphonopyruvate decarboxylase
MIDTPGLVAALRRRGVRLFAGVPDSLLQSLGNGLVAACDGHEHVVTVNEGNAVALAMGHYLATGAPGCVYMQNSGLGNAVNPLASLADPEVYGIPMILVVGWRGEPGTKDEPQHVKQGRITEGQLRLLEIPHWVLDAECDMEAVLDTAWHAMQARSGPVALLVRAGALGKLGLPAAPRAAGAPALLREDAIAAILESLRPDDIVLATTGKAGRELYELRVARGEAQRDFLTVGGMGHTASVALGIALARPARRVVCLDGDGSLLMHLGAMALIGDLHPANLLHVLLNNRAHDSVGGQPTVAGRVDFEGIARACRYAAYRSARTAAEVAEVLRGLQGQPGPHLFEIHLDRGARDDLGRPRSTPQQNKVAFMGHATGRSQP